MIQSKRQRDKTWIRAAIGLQVLECPTLHFLATALDLGRCLHIQLDQIAEDKSPIHPLVSEIYNIWVSIS